MAGSLYPQYDIDDLVAACRKAKLSVRDTEIFIALQLPELRAHNLSTAEVGEKFGLTRQRILQIENRVNKKIKPILEKI